MSRISVLKTVFCAIALLSFASLLVAGVHKDHLTDYGKGIIEDYSDMSEGVDVEWQWVKPGFKIGDYNIDVAEFQNLSDINDNELVESATHQAREAFERLARQRQGDAKGSLATENAIFWAERPSRGKRWIPYAGAHLAQAGCGIEMIFRDSEGNIVAKLRHSGREGGSPAEAAIELMDEIFVFVRDN